MDIVTQGLAGAALAQASAKPSEIRLATLIGFFAPLLADADALIRSADDPLLQLDFHRHFSHALLFIPFGALIAALLFWPFLRKRMAFGRIYLFALLGYASAGFLDACTSYGTHLFWPFSDERTAWSIISIFDPVFSLVLLTAVIYGLVKTKQLAAKISLVFAAAYLSLGVLQHERAAALAMQQAKQRSKQVERLIVKPTMGNLLLWRSVYEADEVYHVDAVRVGLFAHGKLFAGQQIKAFDLSSDLPELTDQVQVYRDIERFEKFSDGYLAWHPERPNVIGDIRYAMLPTSVRPLWGIELNLDNPDQHVTFETYREMKKAERKKFIEMLFD